MHIQLESQDLNAISSYEDKAVLINGQIYSESLIVSAKSLITPWNIHHFHELSMACLQPALDLKPEIILLAAKSIDLAACARIQSQLNNNRIAFEVMNQDAAYRTYNVLLSEGRSVVLCVIYA